MKDEYKFTILGCGSSPGVPRIGRDWGKCNPNNPKNRRRRASMLIEKITNDGTTTIVVDTGPDFREQMIDAGVSSADAVIYTHPHADHIHGIDDLRSFVINRRERVQVWADEATGARLHQSFGYCFKTPEGSRYPPILEENRIRAGEVFSVSGAGGTIEILPFEHPHGDIDSLGFRIGDLAYCSDISGLDERALPHLEDLEVWVVDALQYNKHPSHFCLSETLEWIERLQPRRAFITHMHTPLDYETVMRETPDYVEPCYDGLQITL